jgi:hypothetical protein
MFKRNQVIIIRATERTYNKPRLAIVKSQRKDGSLNCTFSMYKDSNIMTDYIVPQDEIADIVVGVADDVSAQDFRSLATCFPNKDPNDPYIKKQALLDAQFPQYARMRSNYGPYETGEQVRARLRREGKIKAAA